VAQYLSVTSDPSALRSRFQKHIKKQLLHERRRHLLFGEVPPKSLSAVDLLALAGQRLRQDNRTESHRVLAELPFRIYVTTNVDRLLVDALKEAGKQPEVELCRWSEEIDWPESVFVRDKSYRPSSERPLVFYLFGTLDHPDSLVLTEDDYFDYLIGRTRDPGSVPEVVRSALVNSSLMYLGFRLDDWGFRVLFRSLMSQGGRGRRLRYRHVAVQIDPEEGHHLRPEGARSFLVKYFEGADIRIYWGHVEDFIRELHQRWVRAQEGGRV
jgi:hypothetical protein